AQSCTFAPRRTTIGLKSARSTALYHTDAFSSTVTSPTSTAVGATKADGWTFGLFPSKLNSGMVSTLAVCSECSHLTRSLEGGKVEWRSRASPASRRRRRLIASRRPTCWRSRATATPSAEASSAGVRSRGATSISTPPRSARTRAWTDCKTGSGAARSSWARRQRAVRSRVPAGSRATWISSRRRRAPDGSRPASTLADRPPRLPARYPAGPRGRHGLRLGDGGPPAGVELPARVPRPPRPRRLRGDLLRRLLPRRPARERRRERDLRRRRGGRDAGDGRRRASDRRPPHALPPRAPGRDGVRVSGWAAARRPVEGRPQDRRSDDGRDGGGPPDDA